jgi:hypothetical protein
MMATGNGWLEEISEQLWGVAEAFGAEVKQHGFFAVLRPVAPFNQPSFLVPVVTVGALVAFLLLSGIARAPGGDARALPDRRAGVRRVGRAVPVRRRPLSRQSPSVAQSTRQNSGTGGRVSKCPPKHSKLGRWARRSFTRWR